MLKAYKPHRFQLPKIELWEKIDANSFWFPEDLTPWFSLPSYAGLPQVVKTRYNQYHALLTNEFFSIFELELLTPILQKKLQDPDASPEYKAALRAFCQEEIKHAQMFYALNIKARPDLYSETNRYPVYTGAKNLGPLVFKIISKFPDFFAVWVWIGLYFEERTLFFSKECMRESNRHMSPAFKEVHRLHFLEEVHHVNMDELLIDKYFKSIPSWQKKMSSIFMKWTLAAFAAPRNTSKSIAKLLLKEFPQFKNEINVCVKAAPGLAKDRKYLDRVFGSQVAPRMQTLMGRFPEMENVLRP